MKIAFCLFKYYPFGGLERDLLRTVHLCISRGHEVVILTMRWQGEKPDKCNLILLPVSAWTNHGRAKQFSKKLQGHLNVEKYDAVVGFNRMPHLDYYFQADLCYRAEVERKHGCWYKHLPRYKIYAAMEKAVFSAGSKTKIFLLNSKEKETFQYYYHTQSSRFYLVPPGIDIHRKRPDHQESLRNQLRNKMNIDKNQFVLLMVGSDFERKGVDRSLKALATLPKTLQENLQLWIVGKGNQKKYRTLSKKLGVEDRVIFWGVQDDVLSLYACADVLLHPAREENTGTILVEALVNGLPVLVSENCGYASIIKNSNAGEMITEPFVQNEFNQKLLLMLSRDRLNAFRESALSYSNQYDFFHLTEYLVEVIENGHQK